MQKLLKKLESEENLHEHERAEALVKEANELKVMIENKSKNRMFLDFTE